jgi:calcineurin-like phosphoesterase family protein
MVMGWRYRPLKKWGHLCREQDQYMLMLRVDDWKLGRKTAVFRSLVPDFYAFPPFPHITLYGPFLTTAGEAPEAVYNAIESAAEGIPGLSFNLSGYLRLKGRIGQAVTHRVVPSDDFIRFHNRLWHSLAAITRSLSWIDRATSIRQFHITHAYNLRTRDADLICKTVKTSQSIAGDTGITRVQDKNNEENLLLNAKKPLIIPDYAPLTSLRIILLKNGVVDREFDLPAHEWLNRQLVFNRNRTAVSLMQYRKLAGLELATHPEPLEKPPFILSDLHLGHYNIIRYCRRPFSNAGEMDRVLIGNWNQIIGEADEVIYLGDLRYSPEAPPSSEYLTRMNGRVTMIRGNHDADIPDAIPYLRINYNGDEFLFIHDPGDAPPGFTGWVVHGHYHNNDVEHFPFINVETRHVNVSCELTGYRPVSLETIHTLIREYSDLGNLAIMPGAGGAVTKRPVQPEIR